MQIPANLCPTSFGRFVSVNLNNNQTRAPSREVGRIAGASRHPWLETEPTTHPNASFLPVLILICFLDETDDGFDLIEPSLIQQLKKILDQYPDDDQILKVSHYSSQSTMTPTNFMATFKVTMPQSNHVIHLSIAYDALLCIK